MKRLALALGIAALLFTAAWQAQGLGGDGARRADGLASLHARAEKPSTPTYASLQVMVCQDWRDSDAVERRVIVGALRSVLGGEVTGIGFSGRAKTLEDDHAVRLFEAHCRHDHARHYLLYKLYGQAAGLAGVAS